MSPNPNKCFLIDVIASVAHYSRQRCNRELFLHMCETVGDRERQTDLLGKFAVALAVRLLSVRGEDSVHLCALTSIANKSRLQQLGR